MSYAMRWRMRLWRFRRGCSFEPRITLMHVMGCDVMVFGRV